MSGKKNKLQLDLDSVSAKLSGLVEETRSKEPDARVKVMEEKTLTESLVSLREMELHDEIHFDRKMKEVEVMKNERKKNQLEQTKNLKVKREIQLQLLDADKIEVEILKKEMNKLKEVKIKMLKHLEGDNNIEDKEKEPSKDEKVLEKTAENFELPNVEDIEKNLSDLKKKSVQLVSVAKSEKDILTRKIAHLREITVKRANCKRELKEFEKKEKEKGNKEKGGNKVADPVGEMRREELSQVEEDQLRCLDEEIAKAELEHAAILQEIGQELQAQKDERDRRAEKRKKVGELRTKLAQLKEGLVRDSTATSNSGDDI